MPGTSSQTCVSGTRRSQRFKVDFPIKLFFNLEQRRSVLQGRSHDLSREGMAIYIPAELQVGQFIQIEFILPGSNQRLGVNAVVRDCSGFRCGVEFQNLTPIDQDALNRCCQSLASA